MARIDALSIELLSGGKDKLAEEYGKVIENIQARTLSARLKNTDLSAKDIAIKCIEIAGEICVFTNNHITCEEI